MCVLSLLVLFSVPRGFSPGTPVFPPPQKQTFDLICADLSLQRFEGHPKNQSGVFLFFIFSLVVTNVHTPRILN